MGPNDSLKHLDERVFGESIGRIEMSLNDQGLRFCISPDKQQGQ